MSLVGHNNVMQSDLEATTSEHAAKVPAEQNAQALVLRPKSIRDTGLSQSYLADLVSKHIMQSGALDLARLSGRLSLPSRIVEEVLHFLRQEVRIEILSTQSDDGDLRYGLTDRGRVLAAAAFESSGYAGAAPVPLTDYVQLVHAQSVHDRSVSATDMRAAFKDVVLSEELLDRLGPSLNSGRAIFIYGPAGTGKTYITQRFARVFSESVFIPHAILINDTVLSVYDPVMHRAIQHANGSEDSLDISNAWDERYVLCERPAIVVGGELTASMLEVEYDASSREYRAPLQMKANNGIFIIDDMGRQRVSPQEVFNRWIVPLEEKRDYLSLGSGRHFSVPFNVVLVFSTNMRPHDLADEAFLRRIGYKIGFPYLTEDQYGAIWQQQCADRGIPFDREVLDYAVHSLHRSKSVPLLPCHPRDLLGLCIDKAIYSDQPRQVTKPILDWAWENYFARTDGDDLGLTDIGETR
jgi:tRNA A37 threonylcarbamoyladenosine biosynthesis protein TsaE